MTTPLTKQAQDYLEALADELEISETRYRDAEKSYKSLGAWFCRPESSIQQFSPAVYVQGSFGLGTVIKPLTDEEEYDVDSVCELKLLNKGQLSQAELKRRVGIEVEAYRRSQNMVKPLREGRRCWVLDYADGAQFHMDIVPALPNGAAQRILLESYGLDRSYADTAIVITDKEHPHFTLVSDHWPRSNPKGYVSWFRSRMAVIFERKRRLLAESLRASVADIPDYRVRTPLQSAIMILKRHRDMMFAGRKEIRPISIILTTLAAHSYEGEETIAAALFAILNKMDSFIGRDNQGRALIPNPTDPLENFADKWAAHPDRERAFYDWLAQARRDFGQAAVLADRMRISETLQDRIGYGLARKAAERAASSGGGMLRAASVAPIAAVPTTPTFGSQPRVPSRPEGFA
jgi:hypothetical protein